MFRQLCLAALIAPLVSALSVQVPQNPTSEGNITINWTSDSNDPPAFTIELVNKQFNNALAIANNVNTTLGTITLPLPPVPVSDGYSIDAVNVIDITNVFASSGTFSIGAAVPPTHSTSAATAGNTNTSPNTASGTSGTAAGSGSGTNTATSPSSASTSRSSAGTSNSNSNSNSPSASAASPSTTSPSGAISSRMGSSSITALFISIAAGAAAIML